MCVKFQLSVYESSRDIKGIVLPVGSVHLQAREWQFDPDSASQGQFPLLPPTAAIRYSLDTPTFSSLRKRETLVLEVNLRNFVVTFVLSAYI